jgi:hypothetical protein
MRQRAWTIVGVVIAVVTALLAAGPGRVTAQQASTVLRVALPV